MDLGLIVVLIFATIIFVWMMIENANISRCAPNGKCFDGNGIYQYKGRGYKTEDPEKLLNRVDWLAKHMNCTPLYSSSYIIAYALALGVLFILYASSYYILTPFEYIIILITAFVIAFSITNLLNFHANIYPAYYIRTNVDYIRDKLKYKQKDPGNPNKNSRTCHRVEIKDKLKY